MKPGNFSVVTYLLHVVQITSLYTYYFLPKRLFDLLHLLPCLLVMHKVDRDTFATKSSSTP